MWLEREEREREILSKRNTSGSLSNVILWISRSVSEEMWPSVPKLGTGASRIESVQRQLLSTTITAKSTANKSFLIRTGRLRRLIAKPVPVVQQPRDEQHSLSGWNTRPCWTSFCPTALWHAKALFGTWGTRWPWWWTELVLHAFSGGTYEAGQATVFILCSYCDGHTWCTRSSPHSESDLSVCCRKLPFL